MATPLASAITVCWACGEPLDAKGDCVACFLRTALDESVVETKQLPSLVFGDFEVEQRPDGFYWELGHGAMGTTYLAMDKVLRRRVALKVIEVPAVPTSRDAQAVRERFLREARAAAALRHPNVAAIYHFGASPDDTHCYYAMELVEGETLEALVRRDGPLNSKVALEIAIQITQALMAAAAHGLIHRDLKPGNIMLTGGGTDAAELQVKIIDFGLAKAIADAGGEPDLTHGQFVGTPNFASPEQFGSGPVDARSDIYSLGATLWFALTGLAPHSGSTIEEVRDRQALDHLPVARLIARKVPEPIVKLLRSTLAVDPGKRPASARELMEALESCRRKLSHRIGVAGRRSLGGAWVYIVLLGAVLSIGLFFLARYTPSQKQTESAAKSIAVLPFVDLSQAHDQEYFCDGISEEIVDALAKIEGLRVVARNSSFSFKGKNADVGEIAQKLNVQNILEGSLRREGNRIRIRAELVSAANGSHLWSETYERELQGVFAVQDEITRAIVDALKIKFAVAPPARAQQKTEAYDLYLQGLYLSNKSDEESLRKSLTLFQRALDIDPKFARAWTGIAKCWLYLADAYVRPLEAYPKIREAATKALALDEHDAEAHCYLGEVKCVLDRDIAGEEAEVKRALQIDRNSTAAHLFLAFGVYAPRGEWEKAVSEIREAEKLDPLSPALSNWVAWIHLGNGQIDEAITQAKRTLQLDPNYMYRNPILATAYREKGDYARAIDLYKKAEEATGIPQPGLAITYAKMGRQSDARRILDELKEISATKYVAGDVIASIYVALGEKDEAFRWLQHGFEQYAAVNYFIPEFRPLRSDPRFADMLRRTGVDPAKALARQKDPGI
jgi:eukaryotic-like serine/threonine-protein kinase